MKEEKLKLLDQLAQELGKLSDEEFAKGIERLDKIFKSGQVEVRVMQKTVDFEYSDLPKEERNRIILLAIDNTMNPKREITFEQADWLRFTSALKKEGWKIVKR